MEQGVIRRSRRQAPRKSSRAGVASRSALAELTDRLGVAAPIDRKHARAHVAMKRRIRPIADPRDQPMFERIDVAIFNMPRVVSLIADQMLPEPPLPDAAFAARPANRADPFLFWQRFRKAALDQPPAGRKIAVAGWQRPDSVQMVGQDDKCVDSEGMTLPRRGDRLAQAGNLVHEQGLPPLQQVDREEKASAGDVRAMIVRHEG